MLSSPKSYVSARAQRDRSYHAQHYLLSPAHSHKNQEYTSKNNSIQLPPKNRVAARREQSLSSLLQQQQQQHPKSKSSTILEIIRLSYDDPYREERFVERDSSNYNSRLHLKQLLPLVLPPSLSPIEQQQSSSLSQQNLSSALLKNLLKQTNTNSSCNYQVTPSSSLSATLKMLARQPPSASSPPYLPSIFSNKDLFAKTNTDRLSKKEKQNHAAPGGDDRTSTSCMEQEKTMQYIQAWLDQPMNPPVVVNTAHMQMQQQAVLPKQLKKKNTQTDPSKKFFFYQH